MTTTRLPELDGLRCCAVVVVVVAHAALMDTPWWFAGEWGVRLFFVLSAFLITGILLRAPARLQSFRRFYVRRALRIFPAYYVLLAVCWLAGMPSARADLPWHALYGTNWLLAFHGSAWQSPRWYLGHLWSLAVEEQFYLVWPLLVFSVRRPDRVFVALATLAVLLRGAVAMGTTQYGPTALPTWANLDTLAIGALLAWRWHHGGARLSLVVLWLGLAVSGGTVWLTLASRGSILVSAVGPVGIALVAVWLIDRAARGAFPVLRWAPIQYVGRISYGVYLWHLPVLWALRGWHTSGPQLLVADLALTLALASVSWGVIEQPCNRLKDRLSALPALRGTTERVRVVV